MVRGTDTFVAEIERFDMTRHGVNQLPEQNKRVHSHLVVPLFVGVSARGDQRWRLEGLIRTSD